MARIKPIEEKKCCAEPSIIEYGGEFICKNCGVVSERVYETAAEKVFNFDFIHTQILMVSSSNHTRLDTHTDFLGKPLPSYNQSLFGRVSRLNNQKSQTKERLLNNSESILKIILSRFECPSRGKIQIRNMIAKGIKEGLSHYGLEALVIACVYTTLKGILRIQLSDILSTYPFDKSRVFSALTHLEDKKLINMREHCIQNNPESIIERYVSLLFNEDKQKKRADKLVREMLKVAAKRGLFTCGKKPNGYIASAVFLLVTDLQKIESKITQKEIAKHCGVSEVTLRSRAKDLRRYLIPSMRESRRQSLYPSTNQIIAKEINQ